MTLTVEAYDENYEPLGDDKLPGGHLAAELERARRKNEQARRPTFTVPHAPQGRVRGPHPGLTPGEYSLRVKDPVTGKFERAAVRGDAASRPSGGAPCGTSIRRSNIAQETGGRSYDLTEVSTLADDLELAKVVEKQTRNRCPLEHAALVHRGRGAAA